MFTPNSLIICYLRHVFLLLMLLWFSHLRIRAEDQTPYAPYFNPANGFKPAQRDLTKIFLQMAGSLEHFGTPEPYIRHVLAEHTRIAAKYKSATGKDDTALPTYLTDDFVEHLLGNWKKLTPGLKLDSLCRQSGRNMRLAIMGTWNMPVSEIVAQETALSDAEKKEFAGFIAKDYFKKSDFPNLERFYQDGNGYDKLSETGKEEMTRRTARGMMAPEKRNAAIKDDKGGSLVVALLNTHHEALMNYLTTDSKKVVNGDTLLATLKSGLKLDQDKVNFSGMNEYQRDALQYSNAIKADFVKRFQYIRQTVKPENEAEGTVQAVYAMVDNIAAIANSEFRAGLLEMKTK